jgi:hypothetical protein
MIIYSNSIINNILAILYRDSFLVNIIMMAGIRKKADVNENKFIFRDPNKKRTI